MNPLRAPSPTIQLTATVLLLLQGPLLAQETEPLDVPATSTEAAPAAEATAGSVSDDGDSATAEVENAAAASAAPDATPSGGSGAAATAAAAVAATTAVTMSDLMDMLKKQQAQLDTQRSQLADQQQLIASLHTQATGELASDRQMIAKQASQIEDQRKTIVAMQTQIDQVTQQKSDDLSEEEIALRDRLQTLESSIEASQESSRTTFDEDSFPNSISIPGTSAAIRTGGFVKMNIVETFDPLGTVDRFIAGSIPVPQESSSPNTTLTVSQSRLNWDLRDKTEFGTMRAYIEGDFAGGSGSDDTFRLRHAFGQFQYVLAGKTWSVFQDVDSGPEELDFEGINGAVNVRQPQVRYFPKIGQDWNLKFALEDPNPEVTGGTATSKFPDITASARRTWFDRWHIRSSLVLRQITAIWADDPTGDTESQVTGWGISLSGKTATQFWNSSSNDNFLFQLNFGKGIGRYVNDLNTVGGEDAVFDQSGNLHTLPVFAGYVAYQHWWSERARTNFNLSWVNVSNLDFEPDGAYDRTVRSAINYIWSPTARIDLGAELIWGQRTNKDEQSATATQIQISSKYRF